MDESSQLPLFRAKDKTLRISENYESGAMATLYLGDRLKLLEDIRDSGDRAELIVTSPPYNIGKEYETQVSLEEYIEGQRETIRASVEILSPTGSICWQVGHYIKGSGKTKEAYPLDIVLYPIFKDVGLVLKNRIVWHFGSGLHETYRFSGRHETILWFTHDTPDYTFNLDSVRIPQKYPGKRAYSGPRTGQPSGNPLGKNPSDVWEIPNVKANHVEKTEHPCQFPIGLIMRLVLALTNENDLVVDPYIGVGTTAVASLLCNRRSAGADIERRYLDIAKERVIQAWEGTLRYRPMNKPVYKPTGNASVDKIPDEWRIRYSRDQSESETETDIGQSNEK